MRPSSLILFFFLFGNIACANDTVKSGSGEENAISHLPRCINNENEIKQIQEIQRTNSKNKFKYEGYRKALTESSDTELVARLVYAETLGANCPELSVQIAPKIAAVIANRIKIRKGDARSVVFQRDQFSSSLNNYSESHYRDFLCPKDEKLWAQVLVFSNKALAGELPSLSADTVNYFLYQHSSKWPKEPWDLKEDSLNSPLEMRKCIRFFHAPGWK